MRTLIVYATKYGTTENCARLLGGQLSGEVEFARLGNRTAPDLSGFDQVILGGSIYIGKIQAAVRQFAAANQAELLQKRLGLFICCMAAGEDAEKELQAAFTPELFAHAAATGIFGGCFILGKMNWLDKKIIKMVNKQGADAVPLQEGRDIERIDHDAVNRFAAALGQVSAE